MLATLLLQWFLWTQQINHKEVGGKHTHRSQPWVLEHVVKLILGHNPASIFCRGQSALPSLTLEDCSAK